jgi:DNA-binding Lrp family transcriptional regulator
MANIDETDAAILTVLQNNARTSNRDVAAAVGVSPTTALERTRGLYERGVVTGARLDVDLPSIGRSVQALISVRIRPPKRAVLEAFRDWVAALPETLGVFVTAGDQDFMLHVAVADNDALYAFVIDTLTTRPEIVDVRTAVVYEHLKRRVVEAVSVVPPARHPPAVR